MKHRTGPRPPILEAIFDPNSKKQCQKSPRGAQSQKKEQLDIYAKNDAEKNIENIRKGYQNDAQMDTNIYDFSYFFEKGENARNYLF